MLIYIQEQFEKIYVIFFPILLQVIHTNLGLLKMEKALEQENKVYVLPCFLKEKWKRRDYNNYNFLYTTVKFSSYSYIFKPICENHHWTLLVADVKKRTVTILDSLWHSQKEVENLWRYCKL